MAQAAADVDDLPTYEPAADTAEQGTLVTIHGRYATLSGVHASAAASGAVSYSEGDTFDSICFGRAGGGGSTPIEHNSILLIPGLLTPAECEKLIRDVERTHTSDAKKDSAIHKKQRRRMHIPALPDTTVETYDTLLRERLLPFTSRELPAVEDYIWRRSSSLRQDAARDGGRMPRMEQRSEATPLSELQFQHSEHEPAINRYGVGGNFAPHRDKQALTVNVLLRAGDAFEGGGTAFWREHDEDAEEQWEDDDDDDEDGGGGIYEDGKEVAPTLTIHPTVAGVGVLFNGTVTHAGRGVTSGLRHVLVSSFSIKGSRW